MRTKHSLLIFFCLMMAGVINAQPCFDNNFCEDPDGASSARNIGLINSVDLDCVGMAVDSVFADISGCNFQASPDAALSACAESTSPTVWFRFETDQAAHLLNVSVISATIAAPAIQLWRDEGGGCDDLTGPVALTNTEADCLAGFGGKLVAHATPVDPSSTYYLAVGAVNAEGGEFELALAILQNGFDCVLDQEIRLVSRSSGEPLDEPLQPGETVGICMNVNAFSSSENNCQWFQGIVPVFGNGWDPALSFEDGWGTPPMQATLNGSPFPANGQSGSASGIWDWITDANYHYPHCFYRTGWSGDTANYTLCNVLYDSQCSGNTFQGGSSGPCWGGIPGDGDVLPPGWFHYNIQGACPEIGHPNVDWGDGACCSCSMGPWQFCFELTVRPVPVCDTDSTSDLSVGFFTFADGETGTWTGGPSNCGQGAPAFARFELCCATAPVAQFTTEVQGLVLTTENQSTGGGTYLWHFGDGDTSVATNPTHVYQGAGQYTVTLIVTNECGTDTSSMVIDVMTTSTRHPARDVLDFECYPNPGNGLLHVRFGDITGSANLRVRDVYGRIVYMARDVVLEDGAIRNVAIGSVPGVYYLEARIEQLTGVYRIIVQ